MGPRRSGALGLRVSAKRASLSKRHSGTPRQGDAPELRVESASMRDSAATAKPTSGVGESWVKIPEPDSATSTDASTKSTNEPAPLEPPAKGVQFIPKFKGAAEMEARRKVRMQARRGPLAVDTRPPPPPVAHVNPEFSSSDDDAGLLDGDESSDDDFEEITGAGDDMDDGDEFDP